MDVGKCCQSGRWSSRNASAWFLLYLGMVWGILVAVPKVSPAFALGQGTAGEQNLSESKTAQLAKLLDEEVAQGRVGSVLALLARSGQVVFVHATGEADPGVPIKQDAIVRLASTTKPITATAVMILAEQGKLSLDDPLYQYFPAFRQAKVRSEGGGLQEPKRPIVIKDLLTHTSGLAMRGAEFEELWEKAMALEDAITTVEFTEQIAHIPMQSQPGEAYDYGFYGSSYEVLAALIEKVSGQTLGQFFEERIFRPLSIKDTSLRVPEEKHHRLAARYQRRNGQLSIYERRGVEGPASRFRAGGGALRSTLQDYFRFAQCLLNGGALDGVRILKAETVRLMMTDQVEGLFPFRSRDYGWGLGASVRRQVNDDNPPSLGTYSWNGGTGAFFWIDPREEMVGVLFSPFNPPAPSELYRKYLRWAYDALEPLAGDEDHVPKK